MFLYGSNRILIPPAAFGHLLRSNDNAERLAGLTLIVSSHSKTRLLSRQALKCLATNFPHLFLETDANTRGEVLVCIQRLLDRIKAATSASQRAVSNTDAILSGPKWGNPPVKLNRAFVAWYLEFINAQLHPAATYQSHITSLRALLIVAKSGLDDKIDSLHYSKQGIGDNKWSFHLTIFDKLTNRLLHDLLMDPFDDVRGLATELLAMRPVYIPSNVEVHPQRPEILSFLKRAENRMFLSGRADYADGVSRTYSLLFRRSTVLEDLGNSERLANVHWWNTRIGIIDHLIQQLEDTIEMASVDLSHAVSKAPMHGTLASLR